MIVECEQIVIAEVAADAIREKRNSHYVIVYVYVFVRVWFYVNVCVYVHVPLADWSYSWKIEMF